MDRIHRIKDLSSEISDLKSLILILTILSTQVNSSVRRRGLFANC